MESEVEAFKREVIELMREHGLCLSHEDAHGGFAVVRFDESNIKWFEDAHDWTGVDVGERAPSAHVPDRMKP